MPIRISLVLILGSIFCFYFPHKLQAGESDKQIVVVDDMGRSVELDSVALRVISLAPHITENIFTIGAQDQLVGVVDYSDFPEAAKLIPSVGSYKRFNLEVIASLQPDLIIGWASGNGMGKLQQLIDLGFTVYISEPTTMESVADNIERYAVLTAHDRKGNEVSRLFRKTLAELRNKHKDKQPLSVFYQVWNKPLQTLNDQHIISDVIRLCGGENSFGNALVIAPKVGVESVLKANPDVIIASGMGESRPEWLDEWLQWKDLQAVKNKNLYFIPPDHLQRHTVRMLLGAERMCRQLEEVRQKK